LHRSQAALLLIDVLGINLEARTLSRRTPLMLAAEKGEVEIMRAPVARGVDVEAQCDGSTALAFAIAAHQEHGAVYLLEGAGASLDLGGGNCVTTTAASCGCSLVLKATLRRMQAQAVDDATMAQYIKEAAFCAIDFGKLAILKLLVEKGLDVTASFTSTMQREITATLLHVACEHGSQEIAAFLLDQVPTC
jgi:ankyrin repeat protein